MSNINESTRVRPPGDEACRELKVLVMCEEKLDIAISKELLRIPGCSVQVCRDNIELLLYLEHETFQLVMIFQGNEFSADLQETANYLAEFHKETAILFVKQPVNEYLREKLESPN